MNLDPLLRALRAPESGAPAVRDWSLFVSETCSLSIGVKDCQVGNAHVPVSINEACGARYRLIWEDGAVSRGSLERRLIEQEPERALADARAAAYDDPDAAWVLGPAAFPEVELFDAATAELARGRTDALTPRLDSLRRRLEAGAFRTWSGSMGATIGAGRVLSSAGLDAETRSTTFGWHATLNGEAGDGFGARLPESESEFEQRLDRLVERSRRLQEPAEPREGGIRPVLLHPDVVEGYVLSTLLENLNGSTVANGEGHFRKEQFGSDQAVLREDLGLRLDPLQPMKRGAYRFTTEGVPAARCGWIERGRLIRPILDLKYARRLGMEPTPLPGGADTLHLEGPPPLPFEEALARAAGGALVYSVLGVHTQDSASGDFSLSAPQVLAIGDDGLDGRLRATISGNLFELLASDDLQLVRFEGEHTPGLLVACRLDPQ